MPIGDRIRGRAAAPRRSSIRSPRSIARRRGNISFGSRRARMDGRPPGMAGGDSRGPASATCRLPVPDVRHTKARRRPRAGSQRTSVSYRMEGSMVKAAVMYSFNEPLKIESLKLKAPREDEVVVKVAASGVCHSDLSVVQDGAPDPAAVRARPRGCRHRRGGRQGREGSASRATTSCCRGCENCGKCHYCISGRGHLCDTGIRSAMAGQEAVFEKDGVDIARMAGVASFAEHTIVRATAAIKIPDDVPLDRACLVGCGVMTGVGAAINTAKVRPGETVAVFGCGGVGLNVIQGAALCGASRIIAVDLVDSKLKLARAVRRDRLVNGKQADAVDAIKSLTGGLGVDYAFEVIGAPSAIQQAFCRSSAAARRSSSACRAMGEEVSVPGWSFPLEEKVDHRLALRLGQHAPRHAAADRPLHAEAAEDRRADLAADQARRRQRRVRGDGEGRGRAERDRVLAGIGLRPRQGPDEVSAEGRSPTADRQQPRRCSRKPTTTRSTRRPSRSPTRTDRNFYDRYFFNGYARDGEDVLRRRHGHLPAFERHRRCLLGRSTRGGSTTCARRAACTWSAWTRTRGPISVEVVEPLQTLRMRVDDRAKRRSRRSRVHRPRPRRSRSRATPAGSARARSSISRA